MRISADDEDVNKPPSTGDEGTKMFEELLFLSSKQNSDVSIVKINDGRS